MLSLSASLQFLLAAIVARCFYLRYFHPLSRYPGPFLASITNLWKFYTFVGGKHHLIEQALHAKHGPVIRVGPNSLAFSSLSAFDAIYGFNKSLEKGDFYNFGRDVVAKEGNIFSARTDVIHREHRRKVVGPALSSSKVATYEPVISKMTSVFLSRFAKARSSLGDAGTVDVTSIIHGYTFDTLVEIVYGEPVCPQPYTSTPQAGDILSGFRNISKFAWAGSLLPWFGQLMATRPMVYLSRRPTYDREGNLNGIAALTTRTRDVVFTHPEVVLKSHQPSIVQNYLQVPKTDTKHMNPDEIWRETFNLTFAGPGSTAAGLTAILYTLGTHPEWQDRIRADVSDDVTSLVLLAVIKETLRLHVPFPTAFPRSIAPGAETVIPDLPAPLPVGTLVSANTYILGHSKEIWGDDVESWKPERWLVAEGGEGSESANEKKKKLEDSFVVFSKGPRGCIGKEIAMLIMAGGVLQVLERWDIRAEGEMEGDSFLEMQYSRCGMRFLERVGGEEA